MDPNIELKLTVDDVNTILSGLGSMPFAQVYELIGKIQQQASDQLEGDAGLGSAADGPPVD